MLGICFRQKLGTKCYSCSQIAPCLFPAHCMNCNKARISHPHPNTQSVGDSCTRIILCTEKPSLSQVSLCQQCLGQDGLSQDRSPNLSVYTKPGRKQAASRELSSGRGPLSAKLLMQTVFTRCFISLMLGLKMVLRTADLLSVWMKRQQISVRLRERLGSLWPEASNSSLKEANLTIREELGTEDILSHQLVRKLTFL